jgi:hypothetical protein
MAGGLAQFKSTLVYEALGSATALLADLEQIREFDRQSEVRLRMWKILTAVSTLVLVGGTALALAGAFGPKPGGNILGACVLFGGLGLVTGIVLWVRGARLDLADRRYELFGELTRLLSHDMEKDGQIAVALDLARTNDRRKKTGTGKVRDWNVDYYQDPWLRLRGRFLDGTKFQITIIEKLQARSKWKRSRSGKNKYKSKKKSSTLASVLLLPRAKRYQHLGKASYEARRLVRLPPWAQVKNLTAGEAELALTASTSQEWSVRRRDPLTTCDGVEWLGTMLLSLYQVLHMSKSGPKD